MRDALVHLVEGGLYPYIPDNGSPKPFTGRALPPLAMFPAAALSGLMAYRGQTFPETMRGNLFSAQHNTRKIVRHVLQHEGSTFRAASFDFLTTDDPDVHFSDVLEDADGSLLAVDTGSWYVQHCPTGRIRKSTATGGIYRVRAKGAVSPKDPWGLAEEWTGLSTTRLVEFLADERAMVRDRAQRFLNARGEKATAALTSFLMKDGPRVARQAALWAVAGGKDPSATGTVRAVLKDADPELVVTAARVAGLRHDSMATNALHELLSTPDLHVRRAAAEALAECGTPDTVMYLWRQLAETNDPFLEHALVYAAHRLADADALQTALAEPNARVQRAALQLLAQPPRPASALKPEVVLARAGAEDAQLRQTALTLLRNRREWSSQAAELVSAWLKKLAAGKSIEEAALRDLVVTFQHNSDVQKSLAAALTERRPESRRLILEIIAQCTLDAPPIIWEDPVATCITDADPAIRARAIRAAIVLGFDGLRRQVLERAEDSNETVAVRLEAVRLSARQRELSPVVFDFIISQLGAANDPLSKIVAAERLGQSQLSDLQLRDAIQAMEKQQLIVPSRLLSTFNKSTSERASIALLAAIDKAMDNGWRPAEVEFAAFVERLPAAVRPRAEPLKQRARRDLEGERAILERFTRLLDGGNAEAGRALFFGGRAGCYVCHAVGNEGGRFGPDLTMIGAIRSGADIVEAVVLPSVSIAQGYQSYALTSADGIQISGIIIDQDAERLSLRDPAGGDHWFATAQIKTLQPLPFSFMPEGMATALSEQEFRNLLAFLQQLR
jgi:putative heme-binding domain-containing protein